MTARFLGGGRVLAAAEIEAILELSGAERLSIEDISRDVDVPLIEVANLFKVERANLECVSKIRAFVPVIASRQVRTH